MPRKARIDAPGALHHIIVRGIERGIIFEDDWDRNRFLDRLGGIVEETGTRCLAWALIPNHAHLLLKTGRVPVATVMRRLLTGYAVNFNRLHRRYGHLFQNRYKAIRCQEDACISFQARGIDENPLIEIVAGVINVEPWQICASGKQRDRVRVRSLFCYQGGSETGDGHDCSFRKVGNLPVRRQSGGQAGKKIARSGGYELERQLNIQN